GGRFAFADGGWYCGGWENAQPHGHGECAGPRGRSTYSGSWHRGFEVLGEYRSAGLCYWGRWAAGRKHGLGV
ncbi:hypothetical protein PENTCL1PPCAC_24519, partial [Pristionchus entomophagus]